MEFPFQSSTYDFGSVAVLAQFLQWKSKTPYLDWWAVKKNNLEHKDQNGL